MLLADTWPLLEQHLFSRPSSDRLFNPYRDAHPDHDVPGAAAIRRRNLKAYLACYEALAPLEPGGVRTTA